MSKPKLQAVSLMAEVVMTGVLTVTQCPEAAPSAPRSLELPTERREPVFGPIRCESSNEAHPTDAGFWSTAFAITRMARWLRRRGARLDLEVMPDYLKRDIGLMDGRDPPAGDQRF